MDLAIMTVDQLYNQIKGALTVVNDGYNHCIDMLGISPFDTTVAIVDTAVEVVQAVALVLVSLFFIIEFFQKSLNLEWVKWENVLMLFMKIFVAKAIVDNCPWIMDTVYSACTDLTTKIDAATLPDGLFSQMASKESTFAMFFTNTEIAEITDGGFLGFTRLAKWYQVMPYLYAMQGIMIVAQVIVIGRLFELIIYTIVAPIPLATFVNAETKEIGKSFAKNYVAVCLQAFIIQALFLAFTQLLPAIRTVLSGSATAIDSGTTTLICVMTLGMTVFKSGSWAKKICGAV